MSAVRQSSGPVAPGASAHRAVPVDVAEDHHDLWSTVTRRNRSISLRHGHRMLEGAGNLDNFRRIVQGVDGDHGHASAVDGDVKNFVDSDVYKWLEAVAWSSAQADLPEDVARSADAAIALVCDAQDDDGYLNTWYQTRPPSERFSDLQFGHELYCLGHLIQAGIAWRRSCGDDRLLTAARAFADLAVHVFADGAREEVCGHPLIETALAELTRETGDDRYVALAGAFIRRRGRGVLGPGRFGDAYFQDRKPLAETEVPEGHAVRALYLEAGAVDVAQHTGDAAAMAASRDRFARLTDRRMHLTGGVGSRYHGEAIGDDFELTPDRAYCETCAGVALVMWGWRLLLVEPSAKVADVIERALLNAVLVGVSSDGARFQYENPLQVRGQHPRREWFEIACCPPNLMRLLASIQHYATSVGPEGDLYVHQYVSGSVTVGGRSLDIGGSYLDDGVVRVTSTTGWTGVMALRIPAWSPTFDVTVGGERVAVRPDADGYLRLDRAWVAGDVVELRFDGRPTFVYPHPEIDAVRGCAAVVRGPLVYCVEEHDLPAGLTLGGMRLDTDHEIRVSGGPDGFVGLPVRMTVDLTRTDVYSRGEPSRVTLSDIVYVRAVPFMSWGNHSSGGMRVWIPTAVSGPR